MSYRALGWSYLNLLLWSSLLNPLSSLAQTDVIFILKPNIAWSNLWNQVWYCHRTKFSRPRQWTTVVQFCRLGWGVTGTRCVGWHLAKSWSTLGNSICRGFRGLMFVNKSVCMVYNINRTLNAVLSCCLLIHFLPVLWSALINKDPDQLILLVVRNVFPFLLSHVVLCYFLHIF